MRSIEHITDLTQLKDALIFDALTRQGHSEKTIPTHRINLTKGISQLEALLREKPSDTFTDGRLLLQELLNGAPISLIVLTNEQSAHPTIIPIVDGTHPEWISRDMHVHPVQIYDLAGCVRKLLNAAPMDGFLPHAAGIRGIAGNERLVAVGRLPVEAIAQTPDLLATIQHVQDLLPVIPRGHILPWA